MNSIKWQLLILFIGISQLNVQAQFGQGGTVRAVIIGISDYQDEGIPDLKFAHRDAQAFSDYLIKIYPAKVAPWNIDLLINQEATGGAVHRVLNKLLLESKEQDKIFIFFSGHGDVETINEEDLGHLLLYDTPASTYQINSLRLVDLKKVIHQLSTDIGAEVNLITDACRSGNLAGSLVNGSQATAAALTAQFANETKILSCQPNEYSLEGQRWGGGRGVFSYHLIEGLTGLADQNNDLQVTVRELQRYLEDRVEVDAAPINQSPMILGDKNKVLALVDEKHLIDLAHQKSNESTAGQDVISSIFEKTTDLIQPEIAGVRDDFYQALQNKLFLIEDKNGNRPLYKIPSAAESFDALMNLNIPEAQLRGIRGDFIASLQDDAQKAINAYLKSENQEVDLRDFGQGDHYLMFPLYLKKASELLGPDHYLYSQLLAKQYYFEAVNARLAAQIQNAGYSAFSLAEDKIKRALLYDDKAAYLYLELGYIYYSIETEKAIPAYEKATELSPRWVIPYANLAWQYYKDGDYENAEKYAKTAIRISPQYKKSHWTLSQVYIQTGRDSLAENELLSYIKTYGPDRYICVQIGEYYASKGDLVKAKKYLSQSNEVEDNFHAHSGLGHLYYGENDSLAYEHWYKALLLRPKSFEMMNNLAWMHQQKSEFNQALEYYKNALNINPELINALLNLGKIYFLQGNYDEAKEHFTIIIESIDTNHIESYYYLTKIYTLIGEVNKANSTLKKAIDLGLTEIKDLTSNHSYDELTRSEEFIKLSQLIKK